MPHITMPCGKVYPNIQKGNGCLNLHKKICAICSKGDKELTFTPNNSNSNLSNKKSNRFLEKHTGPNAQGDVIIRDYRA